MVGSLNLTARLLILPPLPTELRLRLSQQPRCLAAAVCTRSFLPQTPTLVLPKDPRQPGGHLLQALPGSRMELRVGPGWLLPYTFVHFAAAVSGDSCTGRSSWQLLPEPAPPATRSGKAYVQAARRHNFHLADLLRSWQDSWPNRLYFYKG